MTLDGRILLHEYGTELRLNDEGELWLSVLCGRVGQYGVAFELDPDERARYRQGGDAFIRSLASSVQQDPQPYIARGRTC